MRQLLLRLLAALLLWLPLALQAAEQGPYRRIVTLDWGLAETLIGIGVTPIGVADLPNYRRWVGEPTMPASVQDLGLRTEPNLELLTQLKPDLILITPQFEAARPWLERIAPVKSLAIYRPDSDPLHTAQQVARELGELSGHQAGAEQLIRDFEQQLAQLREKLANRDLPPFYLVSLIDARHVRVYGSSSLFSSVLRRLGQRNAWQGGDNFWGFSQTGVEQLAEVPEAALIHFAPAPLGALQALQQSVLWQHLPFVEQQRVYAFAPAWQFGGLMAAQHFMRLLEEALLHD
ncbi:Fe(3+)-hydroxamate ABC transporter substrate-binding protein FhuD [Halopseudomonas sp.]|uniref:Fe(3+)-hydroxamate ABC transporter substrate-binding protein FhuD n=1 Tax=Halopseudomonas sp. TaxID=2901191 RepID=UPI003001E85F